LFFCTTILNSCQKVLKEDDIGIINDETIKVSNNFFQEGVLPGIAEFKNAQIFLANNSNATDPLPRNFDPNNGEDPIVLGNQLVNPYTISNMQNAANILWGGAAPIIEANNLYVRFKPNNSEQIELLEDVQDLELQDFPMDYEVLQDGDYFQDPNMGDEEIGWLYSVVPVDYSPPHGILFEVITPLFLTEYTLLEDMAESIANGAIYIYSRDQSGQIIITRTDVEPNVAFVQQRPDPCELLPEYTCSGGGGGGGGGGTPTQTQGIFVEEQTVCNLPSKILPLKNVRVIAKRCFKVWRGFTNENGQFTVTKRFKNRVKVIIKTKNENAKVCKVRGVRLWQMLFPCKKRIGVFDKNELPTIRYVFTKPTDGNAHSKELVYWAATTAHNSVIEFKKYTTEFRLRQIPGNLKLMVTNWGFMQNSGATPMWNKCNNSAVAISYASFFIASSNYITGGVTLLANTLENQMDVIVGYKSTDYKCLLTSAQLRSVVYHELGHAQHYNQAGCDFWGRYRAAIVKELSKVNQVEVHPYGSGNDDNTAPIIATGEMWGNHCEKWYSERHYGNGGSVASDFRSLLQGQFFLNNSVAGLNANFSSIEAFNPNLASDVHRWIPQGLPYDLFDNRNDGSIPLIDNVNGYTINQSFNALLSDVRSISAFKDRLLFQNSNAQQLQVYELFNEYNY